MYSTIIQINDKIFTDDGTKTITDKYSIISGTGTINYVTENNIKILHGKTTNSSNFFVAPNCDITNESDFTMECDYKGTNYWNAGAICFGVTNPLIIVHFSFNTTPTSGLINKQLSQNTYYHLKLTYYNKILKLYINDSLIGTTTNTDRIGQLCFLFGGDRADFEYYVKNLEIYREIQ